MILGDVPVGREVRVENILGGGGVFRRITAVGIHRGDILKVEINSRRGPMIVYHKRNRNRIALGRGVCARIEVVQIDN